ncbi:hypothetical protein [Streptosporangium sp. KLBMP 9127]|nr:hypothetical protein [Streptosporangium sp. KLBMP 9127]
MSAAAGGLELPEDWPGLGDENAEVYLDHLRVEEVLKTLRAALRSLEGEPANGALSGQGTVGEVRNAGRVGPAETGSWANADHFGRNATQASEVLGDGYRRLAEQIAAMITMVEKAVTNYEKGHARSSV